MGPTIFEDRTDFRDASLFRGRHRPGLTDKLISRRRFLSRSGLGLGVLGLAQLMPSHSRADEPRTPTASRIAHRPSRIKHVIQVFAQGGPSQVDTWDPKPFLSKMDGKVVEGRGNGVAFASPFQFRPHGRSGIEVSELFPQLARHVDDMALIRSMVTDVPAHDFGALMMNTGSGRLVKPSLGSWIVYGLGTENQNLPGFIALAPGNPLGGSQNWRSAFLPGVYQGTHINVRSPKPEDLIQNIRNEVLTPEEQRSQVDLMVAINEIHRRRLPENAFLEARIQSYELAFRMQFEAMDAFDVLKEPKSMWEAYRADGQFGRQLLMARRLVERGVRVVQVWHGGWDHHQNLESALRNKAEECDQPLASLLSDLKSRGLLEETLVVWGGEFGRTPTRQLPNANGSFSVPGRNHNHRAFSVWLAGGSVKGGEVYGETDDLGMEAVRNKVHVHDLHATLLAMLGFDHERLTYRYNGRDFRLTDVYGKVIEAILS